MSTINDYVRNANYGSDGFDSLGKSNSFLSGLTTSGGGGTSFNLGDWAALRNGSYRKLMKAYYAQEKAQKSETAKDSMQKSSSIQGNAEALKRSVDAFNASSLWEKKKTTTKNEETGEVTEKEDYDWDAISKAIKGFVDSYNDAIKSGGESNSRDVLSNTLDMVKTMGSNVRLLSKVGISIGTDNKLTFDEEEFKKEADIGAAKTIFKGHNSIASNVARKASFVSYATARENGTYTSSGTFSNALSSIASGKIDKDI